MTHSRPIKKADKRQKLGDNSETHLVSLRKDNPFIASQRKKNKKKQINEDDMDIGMDQILTMTRVRTDLPEIAEHKDNT